MSEQVTVPQDYLLRIVAQFVKESGISIDDLEKAVENEILGSPVDTLGSSQKLIKDFREGRWDEVLEPLLTSISDSTLALDLLEHLIHVLASNDSMTAARTLFNQIPLISTLLAKRDPARYSSLKTILDRSLPTFSNDREEERARLTLADRLQSHFDNAKRAHSASAPALESSRLVNFVQDALKWRRLANPAKKRTVEWESKSPLADDAEETSKRLQIESTFSVPGRITHSIPKAVTPKFGKGVRLTCCCTSADGETFVVGTSDGFVELFESCTLKRRKDLEYQTNEEPIVIDDTVTCVSMSLDGNTLACGDSTGNISVFRVLSGEKVLFIKTGHSQGISSLCISPDGAKIASGGVDGVCRLFSLVSGTRLCDFIGHESFVNSLYFINQTRMITGGSDEKCRLWNATTGEQLKVFSGNSSKVTRAIPFHFPNISSLEVTGPPSYLKYGDLTHILVCSPSRVSMMTLEERTGNMTILFSRAAGDIVDAVVSRDGLFCFCWCQDGTLLQIDLIKKSVVISGKLSLGGKKEPVGPSALCCSSLDACQVFALWTDAAALYG